MWYIRIYMGRGDVVYSIIHVSAQSGVHIANYIRFNMKARHVKSNLLKVSTCKIDFTYIRYYLAAKIDFTRKPILAAPDLLAIHSICTNSVQLYMTGR